MHLKQSRIAKLLNRRANRPVSYENLPKTIWCYWDSGQASAPELVQICIESWALLNPGWTIRVLDKHNVAQFTDMSDLDNCNIPIQKYSNLLRTRLLKSHGGVWFDATLLCTKPLDHWLPLMMQTDCFFFSRPGKNRVVSNWFLAAFPNSPILSMIDDRYTAYLTKPSPYKSPDRQAPPYFNYHFVIEYMTRTQLGFRRQFGAIPRVSALPAHDLQKQLLAKETDFTGKLEHLSALPVHKLTWKQDIDCRHLRQVATQLNPGLRSLGGSMKQHEIKAVPGEG